MPRLIAADEWADLTAGLGQRARALNAFLRDVYSEQAIVADGVIGVHALDRAPGFRSAGRLSDSRCARAHLRHGPGVRSCRELDGARRQPARPVRNRLRDRESAAADQTPSRSRTTLATSATSIGCRRCSWTRCARRRLPDARASRRWHCCPAAGTTRPGSSTPSWPPRWASRWCSPPTCPYATESCCGTLVPTFDPST